MTASAQRTQQKIEQRIAGIRWYHSIRLGNGVVTPGIFDHVPFLSKHPLPERMDGMRVLDVGTFDGFWAFEFERRGAAEVVALDIGKRRDLDLQPRIRNGLTSEELQEEFGRGFLTAREILESKVKRELLSVYDISPERLGKFDIVNVGSILLHLLNPVKALDSVRSVVSGYASIAECYSPRIPFKLLRYLGGVNHTAWWSFSLGCLQQMIIDAGFEPVQLVAKYGLPHKELNRKIYHATFRAGPGAYDNVPLPGSPKSD
jgi:tRNA (mo5U34)-methyltransferase